MNNKFKAYNESEDNMSKPFSMPHMLLNFTSEDGLGLMKTLTDEVILQFTGLKDKNGVDIYELMEIDGIYNVEFKDGSYVLIDISNGDIVLLCNYIDSRGGNVKITREYTQI